MARRQSEHQPATRPGADLANNGGPTQTIALLSNSPAINAGDNAFAPLTDQRGYGRNGVSDIGAFEFNGVPPPAPVPTGAVSRKLHNGTPFDVPLPLTGSSGVECRSGGAGNDYQVVVTFASAVTFTGASVTAGAGSVASSSGSGSTTLTVNLTGATSGQTTTVSLANVNDGVNVGNISVPLGVLIGDTNGNRTVNATDVSQVKSQSGQPVSAANFRSDVNASGSINATDIGQVKAQAGNTLP